MSTTTEPIVFRPETDDELRQHIFDGVEVSVHRDTPVFGEDNRPVAPTELICECSVEEVLVDLSQVINCGDSITGHVRGEATDHVSDETCEVIADLRCDINSKFNEATGRWQTIARYSIYAI